MTIAQDLSQQAGTNCFASMNGNDSAAAILMLQEVMAAFDTKNGKTKALERGHQLATGYSRNPAHAAIVIR